MSQWYSYFNLPLVQDEPGGLLRTMTWNEFVLWRDVLEIKELDK